MLKKFSNHTPQADPSSYIAETAVITGDVVIGADCNIWDGVVIRGDMNKIRIGNGVSIQENTTLHVSRDENAYVTIADKSLIGHGCIIHGCQIETNCLIGMGATILDGTIIRENTMVAAGSLVPGKKEFPPNVLLMGSPAKAVRELSEAEIEQIKKNVEDYIALGKQYR